MDEQTTAARPFDSGPFSEASSKPFAAPEGRDPRYDNQPPLEERILMDFVEDVEREGIPSRIAELLASAGRAPTECTDEGVAGKLGDLCKQARSVSKKLDDARERHNRQLIDAKSALKARADSLIEPLNAAIGAIREMLDDWTAREDAKLKEAQKTDYAKRIIEHIRECGNGFIGGSSYPFPILIRELEEKIRPNASDFGAMVDEVEKARTETLAKLREAFKRHMETTKEPQAQERTVAPPEATPAIAPPPLAKPVARGDYGSAVGARQEWKHEIESVRALPDRYLKHPRVIEALDKVIAAEIRTNKVREIKGVKIWPVTKAAVR